MEAVPKELYPQLFAAANVRMDAVVVGMVFRGWYITDGRFYLSRSGVWKVDADGEDRWFKGPKRAAADLKRLRQDYSNAQVELQEGR